MAGYTDQSTEYFTVKEDGFGTRSFNFSTRLLYTFTLSSDKTVSRRFVQSIVTLVCNLGGLATVLVAMAAPCVRIMNYQRGDNHLVQHLYRAGPFQEDIHPDAGNQSSLKEFI